MCLLCSHQNKVTCENEFTHTYSSTVKAEDEQPWEEVIVPVQRIISRQVQGMREFSSSQDSCCLKAMNTSLVETREPSQEKWKAAVNFLTLLWALISPWGVSILFYKSKWAAGFFFTMGPDLLVLQLLRWRHLNTHYSCSAPEESKFHSVIKYCPQSSWRYKMYGFEFALGPLLMNCICKIHRLSTQLEWNFSAIKTPGNLTITVN